MSLLASMRPLAKPILACSLLCCQTACQDEQPVSSIAGSQPYAGRFIDVHFHAHPQTGRRNQESFDMTGAARAAVRVMDQHGIASAIIMPPPYPPDRNTYDVEQLRIAVSEFPDRFAFLGGGGSLNPLIQSLSDADTVPDTVRQEFRTRAKAILASGARGFGELTALHFSFRPRHPFEEVRPDHPLFLLLADMAAEAGVPIDLHMEAVPRDMPTPQRVRSRGGSNPPGVKANIAAFERLLAHNRGASIIWAHAGWDNTGHRTPALMRRLLRDHSNLYMSLKFRRPGSGGISNPLDGDRRLRPEWLRLMQDYPGRFMMASDSHVYTGNRRQSRIRGLRLAEAFFRQLPAPLARSIGYDNARRLYRLGPQTAPATAAH